MAPKPYESLLRAAIFEANHASAAPLGAVQCHGYTAAPPGVASCASPWPARRKGEDERVANGGRREPWSRTHECIGMTGHYHHPDDLKRMKDLRALAPREFDAWRALNDIVKREDGAIPRKFRELIAVAVACTTQCPYCLEAHTKAAKAARATRKEVAEASLLAAALRAGGAATHGTLALRFFDGE